MLKKYLVLFLVVLFNSYSYCQVYDFQVINQEDGLPSSSVNVIFQDSRNYLWIGTEGAGLVRYDGLNYVVLDERSGLNGEFITDVTEDENNNLLVATRYNGFFVYDGKKFSKVFEINNKKLTSNLVYKFFKSGNEIFAITQNEIVSIHKDYSITTVYQKNNAFEDVNSVIPLSKNNFIIAANNGVVKFNSGKLLPFHSGIINSKATISRSPIDNKIYIGTLKGELFEYDNDKLSILKIIKTDKNTLFSIKNIFVAKSGNIWLSGLKNDEICLKSGDFYSFFDKENGFKGENVTCFYQDNNKSLLIGTNGNGLYKTSAQQFISFSNIPYLNYTEIFSIIKNNQGLYIYDNQDGVYNVLFNNQDDNRLIKKFPIQGGYTSIINNEKEVVFGCDNGLAVIDKNNQLHNINLKNYNSGKPLKVRSLYQDKNGNYFIGTLGSGLIIVDNKYQFVRHFDNVAGKKFIDYVYSIIEIAPNKWFVGADGGLFVLKKEKGKFYFSKKIIDNIITVGTKDSFGNYWFASDKNLYVVTKNNLKREYTESDGLISTLIYTLIADNEGNILVGTNLGLAKIKVNKEGKLQSVTNYNSKNGFSGLETNMRAQFKDEKGNVFLGTVKGLYESLASYKVADKFTPKVVITAINLFNQNNVWQTNTTNKWVNLPPNNYTFKTNQNQLTFSCLTINNKITKNALYSYKLKGLNNDSWSRPTQQREVNYSNLSFGKYTFKVRLVDNLGNPISEETSYDFNIQKPFYLSWWFIIVIAGIFYVLYSIIFAKTSRYNKDFVKNYSEIESTNEQYSLYFLFLGITIPVIDLIIQFTYVRHRDTIQFSLISGFILISIYLLSQRYKKVYNNLRNIFIVMFIGFVYNTIHGIIKYPDNLASYFDYLVLFILAYNIFRKIRTYWFFVIINFGIIIQLFITHCIPIHYMVVLLYSSFLVAIINHVRYVINLNSKDKFLFADNIVNKGTSLVLAVNKKGEITYCSETIITILGYTPDEVKGFNYWKLTQDSEFTTIDYEVSKSLYIRKLKCKDGNYKFIQWKDSKYSNNLYVGIGQDVTEQIEVQNQYQKLIESASDIIYETDKNGYFTYINKFSEKLLGYTTEEIVGKHFTNLIIEEYKEKVLSFYKNTRLNIEEVPYIDFSVLTKNKEELWVSQKVTLSRDSQGKVKGYTAIARDITLLKKIEIEQKNRHEKIEVYNKTINNLIANRYTHDDSFHQIINKILKYTSEYSGINRISYWNYSNDKISCESLYDLNNNEFSNPKEILKSDYPKFFEGIKKQNVIVSDDVFNNTYIREFINNYNEHNIKSMIDVAVIANGEKVGVLCMQNAVKSKKWDNDDVSFARSIADIISLVVESKKRIETEQKLALKSEILLSIAKSTEILLKSNNIYSILTDIFAIVAKSTKVDRIYYFENNPLLKTMSQKNEWVNTNIQPQINNSELQNMPHSENDLFINYISKNKVYNEVVKNIKDEKIRKRLEKQKILTILIFPIFVKNKFYGSIGFDDCTYGRTWSEDEVGVLQILANNIATTIERIESEVLLQESEDRFKLLANNIPGTVYLADYDEKWSKLYVNDEIEKLTGYPKSDFLENKIFLMDLIHPDDKDNVVSYNIESVRNNTPFHLIYRLKRKNGEYIWVEEFGDAITKDGKVVFIEGILIDITEKKEIESEIKAREFAEASNKAKSEFLANMSHEIRTPLNAIVGFSNLLQETKLNDNQSEYVETVNQSANILLEVVNDILDFSKIETGKLELDYQIVNLYELANQIIDIIRFDSEQKNISLNLYIDKEVPEYVFIDALRIKQILLNLLSNAVKFTNKGKVELHILVNSKTDLNVTLKFSVIDSGIGIKKDNHKKIFEPFSQEDNSTTRNFGGTGLGLTISNNILGLMDSKLELNSDLQKGSTFYFSINLSYYNASEVNVNNIEVEYEDARQYYKNDIFNLPKKVLIVEDNKINMLLARTLVKKIMPNAVVYEALNGRLGVDKYLEVIPDIILLDIQMPILNGYETAQEIRKINKIIPIIALTAGTIKGEKEKCIETGMNDYISKPIIKEVFENILLKWLQ